MNTTRYAVAGFVTGALLGTTVVLMAGGNISCTTTKSQEEQNLELLRRFEEAYMRQDLKVFDELLVPNQVTHINGVTSATNIDSFKAQVKRDFENFGEIRVSTEDLVARGDRVAARGTWRGLKQKGTGEDWEIHTISISRFENGKIAEYWSCDDALREYQRHGYTLTPPAAPPEKK